MNDFKPGLGGRRCLPDGDRRTRPEGGALRYRGVDINDLVGRVPYEKAWGLLRRREPRTGDAGPRAVRACRVERQRARRLQAETARGSRRSGNCRSSSTSKPAGPRRSRRPALAGDDRDRRRVGCRARWTRAGLTTSSPRARRLPRSSLLRWRGLVDPQPRKGNRHLLDLHGRARAERLDVHRADHRFHRRGTGAAAMSGQPWGALSAAAPRRRSGAGAADARRGGIKVDPAGYVS